MVAEFHHERARTWVACPDANELVAYLDDRAANVGEIRAHVDGCPVCNELVAVLVRGVVADREDRPLETTSNLLAPGTRVGRYVVNEPLGAGAMGVVYAAYDEELKRRVALKLLRTDVAAGPRAAARLLREAQAMARVCHPNVAVVYECGLHRGEVFVAMELVEGVTLGSWTAACPRPWREIVTTLVEAGKGLAAAHAAGIVHRDFKPANVIVGRDGRVRVLDFGLARIGCEVERTGALLGTPAYMAPEQRRREPATEASDQHSFSVVLHEALHGTRPPHASRALPRRLRRIIDRGLCELPGARHASMTAMVEALQSTLPHRTRRLVFALALATAAVAALVTHGTPAAASCTDADRHLDGVWDLEIKGEVRAAFRSTGSGFADDAWRTTEDILDRYAAHWIQARTGACTATRVSGDQTEAQMGLRMVCLDRQLQQLDALVDRLRTADVQTVERAVYAAQALPSPEACSDLHRLSQAVPPPDTAAGVVEVARLRVQLADASSLVALGKYADAEPIALGAVAAARASGYRPVVAEATWLLGAIKAYRGDVIGSELTLRAAVYAAESSGDDDLVARSWIALASVTGIGRGDYAGGLELAKHAQAVIERMGGNVERAIPLALNQARLYYYAQRPIESLAAAYHALSLAEGNGYGREFVASALEVIAVLHGNLGLDAEAVIYYGRARALFEQVYGQHHPEFGIALANEGLVYLTLGDNAAAERLGRQALAVFEASIGTESLQAVIATRIIGLSLLYSDDCRAAIPWLQRTVALRERRLGPDHPEVGIDLAYLAQCVGSVGRHAEAMKLAARAFAIRAPLRGPLDRTTSRALVSWGEALIATGEVARGVRKLEAAIASDMNPETDVEARARTLLARTACRTADRRAPARASEPASAASPDPDEGAVTFTVASSSIDGDGEVHDHVEVNADRDSH